MTRKGTLASAICCVAIAVTTSSMASAQSLPELPSIFDMSGDDLLQFSTAVAKTSWTGFVQGWYN